MRLQWYYFISNILRHFLVLMVYLFLFIKINMTESFTAKDYAQKQARAYRLNLLKDKRSKHGLNTSLALIQQKTSSNGM